MNVKTQKSQFEGVIPYKVYSRELQLRDDSQNVHQLRQILLPTFYSDPVEDSVIFFLKGEAVRYISKPNLFLPEHVNKDEDKSTLERLFDNIAGINNGQVLNDLALSNPALIQMLRQLAPVPGLEPGSVSTMNLYVRHGILTQELLDANKEHLDDVEFYHKAFSSKKLRENSQGENGHITYELIEGRLPQTRSPEGVLIFPQRVYIGGKLFDVTHLSDFEELLYQEFKDVADVQKAVDVNGEKLYEPACITLDRFIQNAILASQEQSQSRQRSGPDRRNNNPKLQL